MIRCAALALTSDPRAGRMLVAGTVVEGNHEPFEVGFPGERLQKGVERAAFDPG